MITYRTLVCFSMMTTGLSYTRRGIIRNRAEVYISLALIITGLVAGSAWRWITPQNSTPATADEGENQHFELLGSLVPQTTIYSLDGSRVELTEEFGNGPAAVLIFDPTDPVSCLDFALEFRVMKRQFQSMKLFLIGIGPDTIQVREYAMAQRLAENVYTDPQSELFKKLNVARHTPLVVVVDSNRRIVFTDARGGSYASSFPVSQILASLGSLLTEQINDQPTNSHAPRE